MSPARRLLGGDFCLVGGLYWDPGSGGRRPARVQRLHGQAHADGGASRRRMDYPGLALVERRSDPVRWADGSGLDASGNHRRLYADDLDSIGPDHARSSSEESLAAAGGPIMSPQAALANPVFLFYLAVAAGLLLLAGTALAVLHWGFHKDVDQAWRSYRGWLIMVPL